MDPDLPDWIGDFKQNAQQQQRRYAARQPKRLGNVVSQLVAKRGYAAKKGQERLEMAWIRAAGPFFCKHSRVTGLQRGLLKVTVRSSAMLQEMNFHQPRLLKEVQRALPDAHVTSLRFRVGRIR